MLYGDVSTDSDVLCVQQWMLNTDCDDVLLAQHWFLMSSSATFIMCSVINGSKGWKPAHTQCEVNTKCQCMYILCAEYFELLKLNYRTVAITVHSVKPMHYEVRSCCAKMTWRVTSINWQCHFDAVCWKQIERIEIVGNCLRFWYSSCISGWKICCVVNFLCFLCGKFSYVGNVFKGQQVC
jgi:hypothetical protein